MIGIMDEQQLEVQQLICGFPEEWREFQRRNGRFLARLPNLKRALDVAFIRTFSSDGPEGRTVFTMGRLCSEEFFEITLLAANGYGYGALKLLRSLFERAVTMAYLCDHPSEVDAFLNYYAISQRKMIRAITDSFGPDAIPQQALEEVEQAYANVKGRYLVACPECGATRVNHTWTKLDVVSMAKKTIFAPLVVMGYYDPMSHSHSTVHALLTRIEETNDGAMGFNPDLQPQKADEALMTAHNIILGVLEMQKRFFGLHDLKESLDACGQDFMDIWKGHRTQKRPDTAGY